jgi:hypothetical protein
VEERLKSNKGGTYLVMRFHLSRFGVSPALPSKPSDQRVLKPG